MNFARQKLYSAVHGTLAGCCCCGSVLNTEAAAPANEEIHRVNPWDCKEQLIEAIRRKKECNARAQVIVESLLEQNVNEQDFLIKLRDINQCHYDDVVDERSILKLCSYPLCNETLDNVPTKQYQISTTSNKVYDITDRKKFCSTHCYKASEYIKSQMLTSPLWMRHQEIIPNFKLLK